MTFKNDTGTPGLYGQEWKPGFPSKSEAHISAVNQGRPIHRRAKMKRERKKREIEGDRENNRLMNKK